MSDLMEDLTVGFIHRQDSIDPYFGLSLVRMARDTKVRFESLPCGPKIDKGRNMIVDRFLATDQEYLLFVDTDMTFSPKMVHQLYEKRGEDRVLSGHCLSVDGLPVSKIRRLDDRGIEQWFCIADPKDNVVKVDITGAAFLLAHRSIYEKVGANNPGPRPYFAMAERWGVSDMGEDSEFCLRAGECGFMVLVDGSVRPGHRKTVSIGNDAVPE